MATHGAARQAARGQRRRHRAPTRTTMTASACSFCAPDEAVSPPGCVSAPPRCLLLLASIIIGGEATTPPAAAAAPPRTRGAVSSSRTTTTTIVVVGAVARPHYPPRPGAWSYVYAGCCCRGCPCWWCSPCVLRAEPRAPAAAADRREPPSSSSVKHVVRTDGHRKRQKRLGTGKV